MEFIRFVIILLIIYYAVKLISVYLFPFLLKRYLSAMGRKYQNRHTGYKNVKKKKEGEVTIDYKPESNDNLNKNNVGEYVDYEEIR